MTKATYNNVFLLFKFLTNITFLGLDKSANCKQTKEYIAMQTAISYLEHCSPKLRGHDDSKRQLSCNRELPFRTKVTSELRIPYASVAPDCFHLPKK